MMTAVLWSVCNLYCKA